jgi:ankyrin repeat protein
MSNSNSLSLTCKSGDLKIIASLLKDIDNKKNKDILSAALLTVVISDDIPNQFEVLDLLWEAGARIEESNGNSILHVAAKSHAKEAIRWILEKKIMESVDLQNSSGMTPFDLLIRNASKDSVADSAGLLLEHGAKVDTYKTFNEGDPALATPLYYAAKEGDAKLVEVLIKHKANVNAKTMLARGAAPNNLFGFNWNDLLADIMPIHVAVRNNSLECVNLLLKNGAEEGRQRLSHPLA